MESVTKPRRHELQAVIVRAPPLAPLTDARQGLVEGHEDGGEGADAGRHQQVALGHLALRRDLHVNVVLRAALLLDGLQSLHDGPLEKRRPCAQPAVPGGKDLLPPPRPVLRRLDRRAVGELQRRTVRAELAGVLGGRLVILFQSRPGARRRNGLAAA